MKAENVLEANTSIFNVPSFELEIAIEKLVSAI